VTGQLDGPQFSFATPASSAAAVTEANGVYAYLF
jgi:hypothetical protein